MSTASEHLPARRGIGWHRIGAMLLRHWYLLTSSWPRLLEMVYWPALTLISWGFLQNYISGNASFFAKAGGTFIGAIILWDILFRGQLGFSMSFLEEMWSRNLGNLMMSPLTPFEFLLSLMIMSLIRLAIGIVPMAALAALFFDFNLFGLGLALVAFFCNLIFTSWAVGIVVSGLVVRNGMGAESLAWTLIFILLPLCLRLLPGGSAAGVVAVGCVAVAADLCVRGHAGADDRQGVPQRPDAAGAGDQRWPVRGCDHRLRGTAERRPQPRQADPVGRIMHARLRLSANSAVKPLANPVCGT